VIDLARTREELLADVAGAPCSLTAPSRSLGALGADPLEEAHLLLELHDRDQLLPQLMAAVRRRFSNVHPVRLKRDVLLPLKRALGNAFKHGNMEDPSKSIYLELVLTRRGALITVSNEGDGFDTAHVVNGLRRGEHYFHHAGGGFQAFEAASSLVSFSDRGRTVLIRFLCDASPAPRVPADPASHGRFVVALRTQQVDGAALESGWIGEASPGSSGMRTTADSAPSPGGSANPAWTFLEQDPPLPLREHLRELKRRVDLPEVLEAVTTAGRALRALHGSAPGPGSGADLGSAVRELSEVRSCLPPERTARFDELCERFRARSASLADWPSLPVHGHFGWSCIQCGAGRLYILGFDAPGHSHPGLDLGGFLADLVRFYTIRRHAMPEFHEPSRQAFLAAYFADSSPTWRNDLDFFEARAILSRLGHLLERPKQSSLVKAIALLDLWERNVAAMELR